MTLDALKIRSLALFVLRFLCERFQITSVYITKHSSLGMIFKLIYSKKNYMVINLWELPQSNLSRKYTANSIEGITHSSVSYSCHLMNRNRFIKKSRRKPKTLKWSIIYLNEGKHAWRQFLLLHKLCLISLFFFHVSIFFF